MQPFFSREDINKNVDLFEVEFKEEKGYSALKAASWNESPLVSFPSAVLWKKSPLLILVRTLDQDEKIHEMEKEIFNLFSLEVYGKFSPVFLKERNTLLKRSHDIYSQWRNLFPYLTYCGKVQEQLLGWSASNSVLGQVLESLTALNTFCEQWNNGSIKEYTHERLRASGLNHKISGESESVRKNETLKKERIFWLPDGRKAFFENHIKLTQGYRIHFYPDPSLRTIYIGYIGKHLRL